MNRSTHRRLALPASLVALALLLWWGQQAHGLATEAFGNAPVMGYPADLLPVLNDPGRVYWYEVNGDARFYYQGDTGTLNALLGRFAAGDKGREVVLHAGPLHKTSLGGDRPVAAQWYVHVPGGRLSVYRYADAHLVTDRGPAVHVYLPSARVASPASPAQIARWVAEFGSDDFAVRENASRLLAKQGAAAEAALRKALTARSAEARARAQALLAQLPRINLGALVVPEGLSVVGPEDLVARCEKGLRSKEYVIRGLAAEQLASLEPDRKKAVEGLVKVLKEDNNEYVRRCVAITLHQEGWAARAALPELRKLADDPDVNVRNACRRAVAEIEKAREDVGAEGRARLHAAIREDIRAFLKARAAKRGR